MFRTIDDRVLVSPQIGVAQIEEARVIGVSVIVNNRPDGEAPDEPQGEEIEAAARAAGLDYVAIPIGHAGFSQPQVDAMAKAMRGAHGKLLAYCRSGTRSTLLWSLAAAKNGDDPVQLHAKANGAGYDLTPVAGLIDILVASRG